MSRRSINARLANTFLWRLLGLEAGLVLLVQVKTSDTLQQALFDSLPYLFGFGTTVLIPMLDIDFKKLAILFGITFWLLFGIIVLVPIASC